MSAEKSKIVYDQQSQKDLRPDEISLKGLFVTLTEWYHYLLSKWVVILFAGLIGGISGIVTAFIYKPVYTAACTFVLEESSSGGGLGQYAGLASMVGIDLNAGGGGIFQGDNLLELYKSRTMIQKTLLSEVEHAGKKDFLLNSYIVFNKLDEKWKNDPELGNTIFTKASLGKFTRKQDSLLGTIVYAINKENLIVSKPDKKLNIIQVIVKAKDEFFAKAFNDQIVKNVNDFYVQTKTKKAFQNLSILQHQTDSVRQALNYAITGMATSIDANPNANPARQVLRVPSQKRQVDVQANTAILEELVKNLEISKVSFRKEAPLIQIIDQPILPLEKQKIGKIKGLVYGGILGGLFAVVFLLIKLLLRKIAD